MPATLFGVFLALVIVVFGVVFLFGVSVYGVGADTQGFTTLSWKTYASFERGISLKYPHGYIVDNNFAYNGLGEIKQIHGIAFLVPDAEKTGTNVRSAEVSIETIPNTPTCTVAQFLRDPKAQKSYVDGGVVYHFGALREVKGTQVHEEQVFALDKTNPCTAVRYTVYSTLLSGADASLHEFDRAKLFTDFDEMRRSLSLVGQH